MENLANICELDENNWVAIAYSNEIADEKLIGRTYKVSGEIAGKKFREYFGDGTADQNKHTAYAMFYKIQDSLG